MKSVWFFLVVGALAGGYFAWSSRIEPPSAEPKVESVERAAPKLEDLAATAIARAASSADIAKTACALCHGARGEGNEQLRAPSIAGQPKWYLRMQLDKFRSGSRGGHPDDASGQQMAVVARALDADALDGVATEFARLPPFATRSISGADADAGADVENGRLVYEAECMECHRFNGQGEKVFRSSPLTSFQGWYLANEFEEFRTGIRGAEPGDRDGEKMRDVARLLDAKARRDVIAYIAELAARHPPGN